MCSESRGSIESTWHNPVGYLYLLFCTGSWGQPGPVKPTHHHAFVMRQRLSDDLKLEVTFVFRNRLVSSRCHIRKKMELDFSAFDYDMIILAYKIHRKKYSKCARCSSNLRWVLCCSGVRFWGFSKVRYFSFSSAYFRKEKSLFCSCLCCESVGFYRVMNSWVPCFKKKKKKIVLWKSTGHVCHNLYVFSSITGIVLESCKYFIIILHKGGERELMRTSNSCKNRIY